MLMMGGENSLIIHACRLRRQILAFPVTIATSGRWPSQNKAIKHFNRNRLEITSMPSGERKPMFLNCTDHIQMDLKAKPYTKWTQEPKPFVSQIYFTINNSSLEKECCFGIREKQCGANDPKELKSHQHDNAAERESDSTKICKNRREIEKIESHAKVLKMQVEESLASQNTKMISSIVISQLIDETKSKENGSALPMQSVITQPNAYHTKQSLANDSSVNINRAFLLLPSRLGIQASFDDNISRTDSHKKGFASITVTARRVVPPFNNPVQVAVTDSLCLKCWGGDVLINTTATSNNAGRAQHCKPLHNQESYINRYATRLKVSESYSQVCEGHGDWISNIDNKENRMFPPGSNHRKKAPVSFTSSVHFKISQHCPNTIYYFDKSLSVCIDQLQIKSQKIHRSILSFNINCSSPRLTPDGADGIANEESIAEILKTKLPEENKTPLRTNSNANLKENNVDTKQTAEKEYLGTACPWKSTSPSDCPAFVDAPKGTNKEDNSDKQCTGNDIKLSIQVPKWSYEAGMQTFSGSHRRQYTKDKCNATAPASLMERAPKNEFRADAGGSLKDRDPSKGTSKSKEIQAQSFLKPKISVSDCVCDIKALSKTALEENDVHRKNQFPKGDYKFCGSVDKIKDCKKSDKQETASRVTTSAAHLPDVPHEKQEAFTQPEIYAEPEKIPSSLLTLREALEVHKPQFISRSQERLKKLEHMAQLRKTQQNDTPEKQEGALLPRKLSSASISNKKKQYTVPHPLSGKMNCDCCINIRFVTGFEILVRMQYFYINFGENQTHCCCYPTVNVPTSILMF
ncbi:(E2-independent) E3 ubiquitin-conjugating enzyme FATS isoform X1 [Malaclemys terrapin pileata]|uniref:(E2-independent) E3 ubiquitin-conjugating enzyme FATS isoform X1 n=1 Tax=Malaclemys terrapin pileata TaxID=2991368 RepID=UPI0023A83C3A|nr:(E2-independent) E3 ubiquitin-conjugating enzyme FATS isoform X1 [Malaclemys terrapin pileata]